MTPTGSVQAPPSAAATTPPSTSAPSGAADTLVVRRHERHTCRLAAHVAISPDSTTKVTLSRNAGDGTGVLPATVVDCSAGGVGIETGLFLPRSVAVELTIAARSDTIRVGGLVQRVTMISREPKYYIGIAFKGPSAASPAEVERLLALCVEAAAEALPVTSAEKEATRARP